MLRKLKIEQTENEFLREKVRKLELELRKKDEQMMLLHKEQKKKCELCGKLTF